MRILVADDEPDMVKVLAAILENEHYAVDTVLDGRSALDYALSGGYDCLVLDIMMPRMSGLEVVRELRSRGEAVPILLLTAKGEPANRIAGLDVGADDYLAKPFVMGEFLARVRACTRRSTTLVPTVLEVGDLMLGRTSFSLSCPATGRGPIRPGRRVALARDGRVRDRPGACARHLHEAWRLDRSAGEGRPGDHHGRVADGLRPARRARGPHRYPSKPPAAVASATTTPTMDSPPSTPDAMTIPASSASSRAAPRAACRRSHPRRTSAPRTVVSVI